MGSFGTVTARVEISLFGTCIVRVTGDAPVEIRGAKHRALFAMLATAPLGGAHEPIYRTRFGATRAMIAGIKTCVAPWPTCANPSARDLTT